MKRSIIPLLWIAMAASAHQSDPADVQPGHPTGHVNDHRNMTWPPQPRGMQDAVLLSDPGTEARAARAREDRATGLERAALAAGQVRQALGSRFVRVGLVDDDDKDNPNGGGSRLVYFSRTKNSTVEVAMDGQTVRGVTTTPASVYQPEITDAEIAEAEGIARAHFASLGESGLEQLQAFGILAYRPEGTGFYDTRVIYVSFHQSPESPPAYAAWVDLTRQTVVRTRKELP